MELFKENLKSLLSRHPALMSKNIDTIDTIDTCGTCKEFELIETPSGNPSAVCDGNYIHSRYNPEKEAIRIIQKEASPDATLGIFYGFGLGYLVEAFHNRFPEKPIIVVEPNIGFFRSALDSRNLQHLLSSDRITWLLDETPERIIMQLQSLPLGHAQIIRLRSVFLKAHVYYRNLDSLIQSLLDQKKVNTNTLKRFGRLWVRNLLHNIEVFINAPGVSELSCMFPQFPALVLAAGPTLDSLLPYINELKKRMLIIAVDTSFKLCLKHGVEPDFLVTVDPQYWNTRHLDWADPEKTILISESSAHPRIFRNLDEKYLPVYFVSSFFPLGRILEENTGEKGRVGAGGSVSTTAWDFTRLLGARPIFMAGLDLGFPQKRTHCRGAFFEERMFTLSYRITPMEQMIFQYLIEADPFTTCSNCDHPAYTDRRMIIYKWWFENQMKQHQTDDVETYNLSAPGVKIDGMPYYDMKQLYDFPKIRDKINRQLFEAKKIASDYGISGRENRRDKIIKTLSALMRELKQLNSLARKGLVLCRKLYGVPENRLRQGFDELNLLDKQILKLSSRQVAGFLIQPLIQKIIDSGESGKNPNDILEVSKTMYEELGQSSHYHLDMLHKLNFS